MKNGQRNEGMTKVCPNLAGACCDEPIGSRLEKLSWYVWNHLSFSEERFISFRNSGSKKDALRIILLGMTALELLMKVQLLRKWWLSPVVNTLCWMVGEEHCGSSSLWMEGPSWQYLSSLINLNFIKNRTTFCTYCCKAIGRYTASLIK